MSAHNKSNTTMRRNLPLPEPIIAGDRISTKSWKNRESEGIGLAIVTSLDKEEKEDRNPFSRRRRRPVLTSLNHLNNNNNNKEYYYCQFQKEVFEVENVVVSSTYPALDFLNYCHMCRKRLQGKDIYMYRGEKAFCSPECRCQQMVIDECQERRYRSGSRTTTAEVSSSPRYSGRLFFTGIEAV
ncbi:hypothetical protein J5N97_002139 [Dioscorea zingiberensis]|uniref:FLZ-type domain-containing protein n=1 Tax=Dioscorea zingiberensis TaxID=325984 RepID=A0A9D5D468_9LILI|nr:hypothetical protein J5N97_002139 [Dioscorea zingiberensis]